jgi:putative membrane protein
MKHIIRVLLIQIVVLYLVSLITDGLIFKSGTASLILTGVGLAIANLFVRPIINLLLLPLNLLTFGFFRFLTNAVTLFLVDLVLAQFNIGDFFFKGYRGTLIVLPSLHLPSGPLSYLAFSFMISIISTVIYWLVG